MTVRDIKRRARRHLHLGMRVPALYLLDPSTEGVLINPRVHTKFAALGTFNGGAERLDVTPKLRLDRTEVPSPKTNTFVSVEEGEMYRIVTAEPPDGEFVSVVVVSLSQAEIDRLWPDGQPLPPEAEA